MERILTMLIALSMINWGVFARNIQEGDYDYPHEIDCDHNHDHKPWNHGQRHWGFQMGLYPHKPKPANFGQGPKKFEPKWNDFDSRSEEQPVNEFRQNGNAWNNWMYPGQNQFTTRFPNPSQWQSRPTTRPPNAVTTASPNMALILCTRACPVTSEYNPVCGSNNITYNNPGRLECAKNCGVDVSIQRLSSCSVPPSTPPPQTLPPQTPPPFIPVSEPAVEKPVPTPLPVIPSNPEGNNNPITISPELLASLFTTEDPDDLEEDIDIRIPDEK